MMSPLSALAAAIELGKQGYSCFPCKQDKTPTCKWADLASTVEEDLKALWSEFPGSLIGVATGPPSQICVLDVDNKPEGREWWSASKSRLLPTRVHRTRSGGLHLIYGNYDGLRNSASKIATGVDVRGNGGYIVHWPSAGFPVLCDAPCAPWPDWLEWLVEPPAPRSSLPPCLTNSPAMRRARLEGLVKSVLTAPEGNRNACLFWAACTVGQMAHELEPAEYSEAVDALLLAGRAIGLPDPEIRRTLKSAERRVA